MFANSDAYHYVPHEYQHFQQAQFLADLCLNFEEISVKRKRVASVPTVMCESIAGRCDCSCFLFPFNCDLCSGRGHELNHEIIALTTNDIMSKFFFIFLSQ